MVLPDCVGSALAVHCQLVWLSHLMTCGTCGDAHVSRLSGSGLKHPDTEHPHKLEKHAPHAQHAQQMWSQKQLTQYLIDSPAVEAKRDKLRMPHIIDVGTGLWVGFQPSLDKENVFRQHTSTNCRQERRAMGLHLVS